MTLTEPAPDTGRPLIGVALVVLATMAFALADTLTKHLSMLYPVPVVMAVRYAVNVAVLVIVLGPTSGRRLWQSQRVWLVIVRGLCLAAASLTMGWALQRMPVGETIAIIYLAPFAVMLLAVPLLGEKVSAVGWLCAALGFLGVLLIVRPGGTLDPLGVAFCLINAGLATAYHLLTRSLGRTETTLAMLFHSAWVGALVFCLLAIPDVRGFAPPLVDIGFMVLLGGLMTIGHFLFTAAYRHAPASLLAPVNYLHLVWAGGLGWLVFQHVPEPIALTGIVLVTIAGAAVAFDSHRRHRQERAEIEAAAAPAATTAS